MEARFILGKKKNVWVWMKALYDVVIKGNMFLLFIKSYLYFKLSFSTHGSQGPFEWVVDICVNKTFIIKILQHIVEQHLQRYLKIRGCCTGPYAVSNPLIV